jgi:hypothetical protein
VALDAAYRKLSGADGRLFADPQPAADEITFQVDNTSAAYSTCSITQKSCARLGLVT